MKIVLYIQDGLKHSKLYQNECSLHFYSHTEMRCDYSFGNDSFKNFNFKRIRKSVDFEFVLWSDGR